MSQVQKLVVKLIEYAARQQGLDGPVRCGSVPLLSTLSSPAILIPEARSSLPGPLSSISPMGFPKKSAVWASRGSMDSVDRFSTSGSDEDLDSALKAMDMELRGRPGRFARSPLQPAGVTV